MKKIIGSTALLLAVLCAQLSAQDLPRTVIGSAGDYYEHALFGNLHWTVGELAVSRFQNGQELGEGFHHAYYDLVVKTDSPALPNWEVSIFPNPTAGELQIHHSEEAGLTAYLYSGTGQLVQTEQELSERHSINLTALPAGVYWLQLMARDGRRQSYQVQKIK
jgi:hypothetical protein